MADQTPKVEKDEIATLDRDIEIFQGFFNTLENPDKVLRLECCGDISVYDDIGRDPRVAATLRTRSLAVIGKEWNVIPASDDKIDIEIAEFVRQVFEGFAFDKARRSILRGGVLKGHAISEILWEKSEGQIWIKDMKHRAQRRFRFDVDDNLRLLTRENPLEGDNLTRMYPQKFQRFVFGDEPETSYGVGLGRELYWPWWFKKHGIKFWLVFCDKFGSPTAVGKYRPGSGEKEKRELLQALDAIQNSSSIIFPDGMSVDLLEAARSGSINTYESLAGFMNDEMTISVLGQTGTTQGTPGKLGNEESHENVREDLVKADADALCESLNPQVVRWVVDYNYPGHGRYPKMWIECAEAEDHKALSERDKNLKETGVRFKKSHYVDTYGINPDNFEVAETKEATQPLEFAEADGLSTLDQLIEDELADWQPLFAPVIDPIVDAVGKVASFDELTQKLDAMANQQDLNPLIEALSKAGTKARGLGDVSDDD